MLQVARRCAHFTRKVINRPHARCLALPRAMTASQMPVNSMLKYTSLVGVAAIALFGVDIDGSNTDSVKSPHDSFGTKSGSLLERVTRVQPLLGVNGRVDTNIKNLTEDFEEEDELFYHRFVTQRKIGMRSWAIGDYILEGDLGAGGFAVVRRARHIKTGKQVALKRMSKRTTTKTRFVDEVSIMRIAGRHNNVVNLFETFETADSWYMVLELASGGELFEQVVSRGAFPETEASATIKDVALALDYLHGKSIVHFDVKPENVLLASKQAGDRLLLADFGLAFWELGPERGCSSGKSSGTAAYSAPEILRKQPANCSADMWSLGVLLYIVLTGHHPFDVNNNASDEQVMRNVLNCNYSLEGPVWKGVSASAKDLVRGLLQEAPADRLTASQVLAHPWMRSGGRVMVPAAATAAAAAGDVNVNVEGTEGANSSGVGLNASAPASASAAPLGGESESGSGAGAGAGSGSGSGSGPPAKRHGLRRYSRGMRMLEASLVAVLSGSCGPGAGCHPSVVGSRRAALGVFDEAQKGFVSAEDLIRVGRSLGEEFSLSDVSEMIDAVGGRGGGVGDTDESGGGGEGGGSATTAPASAPASAPAASGRQGTEQGVQQEADKGEEAGVVGEKGITYEHMMAIMGQLPSARYVQGETVYEVGSTDGQLYLLADGEVDVEVELEVETGEGEGEGGNSGAPSRKRVSLHRFGRGELFGDMEVMAAASREGGGSGGGGVKPYGAKGEIGPVPTTTAAGGGGGGGGGTGAAVPAVVTRSTTCRVVSPRAKVMVLGDEVMGRVAEVFRGVDSHLDTRTRTRAKQFMYNYVLGAIAATGGGDTGNDGSEKAEEAGHGRRLEVRQMTVGPASVLRRANSRSDRFYVIQAGEAEMRVRVVGGGVATKRLGPGDYFGEEALVKGVLRGDSLTPGLGGATVCSISPVKLVEVDGRGLRAALVGSQMEGVAKIVVSDAEKRLDELVRTASGAEGKVRRGR